jgi:hypothetical protein
MEARDSILTLAEAARELRCSKAHLCNVIHGRVRDLPPLPVVRIGRRVLIRQDALAVWLLSVEGHAREALMIEGLFPVRQTR